jgi:hypothetical protein
MQSSIDDSVNATEWEIGIMRRLALQNIEISLVEREEKVAYIRRANIFFNRTER